MTTTPETNTCANGRELEAKPECSEHCHGWCSTHNLGEYSCEDRCILLTRGWDAATLRTSAQPGILTDKTSGWPPQDGCVFCSKIAADALWTDSERGVVSFTPLGPVTPGHRLFVPIEHVQDAATASDVTGRAFASAAEWAAEHGVEEFNLITSAGKNATQSVFHLHVHLVPRAAGDGLPLPWMLTPALPGGLTDETIERTAQELYEIAADRRGEGQWLTWDEICSYSPLSAEEYRRDARRVLAAARVAPVTPGEPTYSLATRQWTGTCPCVLAEQVDPECEWHGRPEFRRGGSLHPDTPQVAQPAQELVSKAARVLHIASCCNLSNEAEHQEPQNEDLLTAGIVLSSVPLTAPPAPNPDREKMIAEAREAYVHWVAVGASDPVQQAAGERFDGLIAALAAAPVVNKAKLAEVIRSVPRRMEEVHSRLLSRDPNAEEIAAVLIERQREWLGEGR